MKNVKKFFSVVILLTLSIALTGCGGAASSETSVDSGDKGAKYEMILSSEVPENHFKSELMKKFAEEIEKRTDGGIKAKFFPAGQLYSDIEAMGSLGTGAVHSVWPVSVQLESFNPEYGVLTLPFAITDENMLNKEYRSKLLNLLSPLVEDQGMSVKGLLRTADLIFISQNKEMKSYKDLSGMKIRMTGGQVLLEMANQFNASAVSIPASEMSTSLSQGVIDSVFSSPSGWKTILGTSSPYGFHIPGLNIQTYSIVFDQAWLNDLPEEYQKEIDQLVDEIASGQWEDSIKDDEAILKELIDEGVTFNKESEENIKKLEKELQPATDVFSNEYPEVYKQFKELGQ